MFTARGMEDRAEPLELVVNPPPALQGKNIGPSGIINGNWLGRKFTLILTACLPMTSTKRNTRSARFATFGWHSPHSGQVDFCSGDARSGYPGFSLDLAQALKNSSGMVRPHAGNSRSWPRRRTIAVSLLVGAALLLISFVRLHRVDLGFDGTQVVTNALRARLLRFSIAAASCSLSSCSR